MAVGVQGVIGGYFHIPSIPRKEDPTKTVDLALIDVVNPEKNKPLSMGRVRNGSAFCF